jgi:hypothetical protein
MRRKEQIPKGRDNTTNRIVAQEKAENKRDRRKKELV